MELKKFNLILGSLLHDIGKIVFRGYDSRNHSLSGEEFLSKEVGQLNKEILDCVYFHHRKNIKGASLEKDSPAYITYIADNIASFADRRVNDIAQDSVATFDRESSLISVFNSLGEKDKTIWKYPPGNLDPAEDINYPVPDSENIPYDKFFYHGVLTQIRQNLRDVNISREYLNSYIQILEDNLTYIPSSTNAGEIADISLYDHLKTTAMFASAIFDYLNGNDRLDYRKELLENSDKFYKEKAFILLSIEFTGIQNFIYKITKENALKNLRARSFYLEIMMEVLVDEILDRLELSRANIMYLGGGHSYLILPNTSKAKRIISETVELINDWLIKRFGTDLYLPCGYTEASADDFRNIDNSYSKLFTRISENVNEHKLHRYSAETINTLNSDKYVDSQRECRICYRKDSLNEDNICSVCSSIETASKSIIDRQFFVLFKDSFKKSSRFLEMPFNSRLYFMNKSELMDSIIEEEYIRTYTKNTSYTGKDVSTRMWLGDYSSKHSIEELVPEDAINRIGVLRADVDNLGKIFVSGFPDELRTISRTSTLSRNLSMFFKFNINRILQSSKFTLSTRSKKEKRDLNVIYSGGDDVFVLGNWEDIIGFAIDLNEALRRYTLGKITLSAGIGIFDKHYPLYNMALETGKLESVAKSNVYLEMGEEKKKNSVTLFSKDYTFSWHQFENGVLKEKFDTLDEFFTTNAFGLGYIYKLLENLREVDRNNQISIARLAYILGKNEPSGKDSVKISRYNDVSRKIYTWARNENDRKELITAIYIYVYLKRSNEK